MAITHYVSPREPTILAGRDSFELSHNNLFISANVGQTLARLHLHPLTANV